MNRREFLGAAAAVPAAAALPLGVKSNPNPLPVVKFGPYWPRISNINKIFEGIPWEESPAHESFAYDIVRHRSVRVWLDDPLSLGTHSVCRGEMLLEQRQYLKNNMAHYDGLTSCYFHKTDETETRQFSGTVGCPFYIRNEEVK